MPGGAEWLILLVIGLFPILALIEIIKSQFKSPENKIIWVIVVLMFPLIGAILFWVIGRAQKVR